MLASPRRPARRHSPPSRVVPILREPFAVGDTVASATWGTAPVAESHQVEGVAADHERGPVGDGGHDLIDHAFQLLRSDVVDDESARSTDEVMVVVGAQHARCELEPFDGIGAPHALDHAGVLKLAHVAVDGALRGARPLAQLRDGDGSTAVDQERDENPSCSGVAPMMGIDDECDSAVCRSLGDR